MKCNCRFQIGDMGYYTCQLEKDHIGAHQYSHDGKGWPRRKYQILWEIDEEKDYIFTKDDMDKTNINDVFNYIKTNFNILSFEYYFEDNSIHSAVPCIWIKAEYYSDFEDNDMFYDKLDKEENEIRKYIDDNLLFNDKILNQRDTLYVHLSTYPKGTMND